MSSRDPRHDGDQARRRLSQDESAVLTALLSAEFPGRSALVNQMEGLTASEIDSDGTLTLTPAPGVMRAEVARRIPVEAELADEDGVTVHVLLHVLDGLMNEMEVYREDSGRLRRQLTPDQLRLIVL